MTDSGGCSNHMEHVKINTSKGNECRLEATLGRVMYLLLLTPATVDDTRTYVTFQIN